MHVLHATMRSCATSGAASVTANSRGRTSVMNPLRHKTNGRRVPSRKEWLGSAARTADCKVGRLVPARASCTTKRSGSES
eukprot:370367-Pleurochrysis_carterae.AAC.6